MAIANQYGIYALDVAGTTIPIISESIDPGVNVVTVGANGTITPTTAFIGGAVPRFRFRTRAVKALLDAIATPWRALQITSAGSPAVAYFRQHLGTGERTEAVSGWQSFTVADGLLIPGNITCQNGGAAEMDFTLIPISTDGTTAPVAVDDTVNDPSLTLAEGVIFTCGPIKINAGSIETDKYTGVQSITINPGITPDTKVGDGELYETFASIVEARPSISVTLADGTALADLGMTGAAQDASDSTVFLTKITENGGRVANATAEHISFAVDDGIITATSMDGQHPNTVTTQVLITPTDDLTNVIVAINTATAIS